jgi:hypothetical protein
MDPLIVIATGLVAMSLLAWWLIRTSYSSRRRSAQRKEPMLREKQPPRTHAGP